MKRTLALFLALLMALSLCACGGDEIELTLDNYKTYLDVHCSNQLGGAADYGEMVAGRHVGESVYTAIDSFLVVDGKSDNYNYNDVSVTVKFTGQYVPFSVEVNEQLNKGEVTMEDYCASHLEPVDITLTANADIIGHGSNGHTIQLPSDLWTYSSSADLTYEIIDVSGTLTPV